MLNEKELPVEVEVFVHTSLLSGCTLESASAKHIMHLGSGLLNFWMEWKKTTEEVRYVRYELEK